VDPVGSGKGPLADSCEYGDEPAGSGATGLIKKQGNYCARFQFLKAASMKMITLMMEAVRTSETSVCCNETARRFIPVGYKLLFGRQLIASGWNKAS
jgi:hypothetical protein